MNRTKWTQWPAWTKWTPRRPRGTSPRASVVKGFVFFFLFLLSTHAATPPWTIPDAPFRARITMREPPTAPGAGYAISLPEFGQTRDDMGDLVLTDTQGQPLPIAKIYRRAGQRMVLLAQELQKESLYFLYFGGGQARNAPGWTPKLSLFMETRRAPALLKMDTFQDVKNAWDTATASDGAGFVPVIYHGENLFGAPFNFLTHYTGYLLMPDEKQITFYTLSSDASFVLVNDQLAVGWPGRHSPETLPKEAHAKAVQCLAGLVKIDYYATKGAQNSEDRNDSAAMVLGWKGEGDSYSAIPSTAWLHPGNTNLGGITQSNGETVPLPKVSFDSFIGYGDQWLYETTLSLNLQASQLNDWTATWDFEDGATVSGLQARRVLIGEKPQFVKLRVTHGELTLTELARVDFTTRNVTRCWVRNPDDVQRYVTLMDADDAGKLKPDSLAARLKFLLEWGTDQQITRLSDTWPQAQILNDPEAGAIWVRARLIALRTHASTDPKKALEDLNALIPQVQQRWPWIAAPLEIDLHVFYLHDADSVGRIGQIAFQIPSSDLARTAKIRTGDLYRLLGRFKEAITQYQTLGIKSDDRSLPAQDRALSITIRDLLENGYRNEAMDRLGEWERKHPMAKFDSDFLLLRARTLMLFGRWHEALVELESFEKVQPDSPFGIDAEFYRARVLYETGGKEEARKIWTAIAKNYPRHQLAPQAIEWRTKP